MDEAALQGKPVRCAVRNGEPKLNITPGPDRRKVVWDPGELQGRRAGCTRAGAAEDQTGGGGKEPKGDVELKGPLRKPAPVRLHGLSVAPPAEVPRNNPDELRSAKHPFCFVATSLLEKAALRAKGCPEMCVPKKSQVAPSQDYGSVVALQELERSNDGFQQDGAGHIVESLAGSSSLPDAPEADDRETTEGGGVDPEVAEAFIESKRIGDRIKFLRQRKQMGLVELGRHTGLSASFLSQLETGRVVPTLRNLARIAMVFSKDMSYFFEPERPEFFRVIRAEERQRLPQTGVEVPGYFFESLGHVPLDGGIAPYIAEFLPAADGRQPRSHAHAGSEFLFVLSGSLHLTHDGQGEDLEQGDAVFFHANSTHSYEGMGEGNCEALIITLQEHPRGHHSGSRVPVRASKSNNGSSGNKRRR